MDLTSFEQRAPEYGVLGLKVSQHDRVIAEYHTEPEERRSVYSAAKAFVACAVGFAIQEGLLSLEEKLVDAFAKDLPDEISDELAAATVRDLLTMRLGLPGGHLLAHQRPLYEEDNWVKMMLSLPFAHIPGEVFEYSNVPPYLAGVLVQKRVGCSLTEYLAPRLFLPLGIKNVLWETDRMGYNFGSSGLYLTLSELHRFGEFCLHRGRIGEKQLLNEAWFAECIKPQGAENYGYLFWLGKDGAYRADGKFGQITVALPQQDAVITVMAECRKAGLLKLLYEEIIPQL